MPILLVVALNRASVLASFAPADRLGSHHPQLVFAGTLLSFVIGTLAWPALAPFAERLRRPRLRNWGVFWGAFILSTWIASVLLGRLLHVLFGAGFALPRLWLVPMFVILVCLAFCEMIQAHADRVTEARRLIDRILTTHEMVRWAKEAEGQKLRKLLVSRVEGELCELRQEVAALRDPARDEAAGLIALRERIDTLRETDLREASHLLHPHVPKAGLAPALAFLARRVGGRLAITVDLADAVQEAVGMLPAPVCHAAYCLAEASLERAADACGATSATVSVGAGPEGQLLLAIDHDCCGCFDDVADSRFDLAAARLELAGGAVCEERAGARERIAMTLPLTHGDSLSDVPALAV
ncbi:MAG TPA: hypothetical protein V6D00_11725 [Pantanalinema sp.]